MLFATLESGLTAGLQDLPLSNQQRVALVNVVKDSAGAAIPALAADPLTAPVAEAARVALTDATRVAALTAAGFLAAGLIASLSLGRRSSDTAQLPLTVPAAAGPPD